MRRALLVVGLVAACGGDPASPDAAPAIDAATAPDAACFTNPQTYLEIINACTDAVQIDKRPSLPLLNADGSLPPLPD